MSYTHPHRDGTAIRTAPSISLVCASCQPRAPVSSSLSFPCRFISLSCCLAVRFSSGVSVPDRRPKMLEKTSTGRSECLETSEASRGAGVLSLCFNYETIHHRSPCLWTPGMASHDCCCYSYFVTFVQVILIPTIIFRHHLTRSCVDIRVDLAQLRSV